MDFLQDDVATRDLCKNQYSFYIDDGMLRF